MSEKAGSSNDPAIDIEVSDLPVGRHDPHAGTLWDAEDWERLSRKEQRRLAHWIFELIESDVREAMKDERFGIRSEEHASRTIARVDERGWKEINRIQDDALLAILAIKAECAERLAESGEAGMNVLSAMLSCELAGKPAEPS